MSRRQLPPEAAQPEIRNPNGHELTIVSERVPGKRPTEYDIELSEGDSYHTRFFRCQNCGQERNRPDHFREPCDAPVPSTPLSDGGYSAEDPRTRRALTENMSVQFAEKGPIYDVLSESGNTYEVDIENGRCSCPDWQKRGDILGTQGCKHLRRTNLEIAAGQVPQPNGTFFR